jgi:hypothetical protein
MEHRFEVVETPVRCKKCGKETNVVFTDGLCSRCARVWSPEQRAKMAETRSKPYRKHDKKVRGKSREDLFKAAPKSRIEEEE